MNLLLADVSQWILFGVLALVIILAPVFMSMRNKKEMAKAQQVMDSLKKGDKILTSAGVIGKIVSISEKDGYKTVTIETGDEKHKGYMTIDIAAIYMNLSAPVEQPAPAVNQPAETEKQQVEEKSEEVVEDAPETETTEQVVEPVETQKQTKSKSKSSKKSK